MDSVNDRTLADRIPGPLMTRFFRDLEQCAMFTDWFLPSLEIDETGEFIVWCIGCSTGEEAYSIAMMCALAFPDQFRWRVIGVDRDRDALSHASAGVYTCDEVREIPKVYQRFVSETTGGLWSVSPEIAERVEFRLADIMNPSSSVDPSGHCIFMRHVLPYVADMERRALVKRLCDSLKAGGALFVGRSEDLGPWEDSMTGIEREEAMGRVLYRAKRFLY